MTNSYDSLLDEPKVPQVKPKNPEPNKSPTLFKGFSSKYDDNDEIIN